MSTLALYRDDGPLAAALGRALGLRRLGPGSLLVLGAAPLGAAIAVEREATAMTATAAVWFAIIAGGSSHRALTGRLDWLVPVTLRVAEYGTILALAWYGDRGAMPAAYALLAATAFHHYDIVYRLRHQRRPPPRVVGWLAGGWELRMLAVAALAETGYLKAGLIAAAAWLGTLFISEGVASWTRAAADVGEEMAVEAGGD